MPQSGGSSYLGNMAARRRQLNRVREALLDRPGVQPPNPTAPPATVPAERPNPQEQAVRQSQAAPPAPAVEAQPVPTGEAAGTEQVHVFDEATRERLRTKIRPFLAEAQKQKLAQLHRRVGRVRKFFGSGV